MKNRFYLDKFLQLESVLNCLIWMDTKTPLPPILQINIKFQVHIASWHWNVFLIEYNFVFEAFIVCLKPGPCTYTVLTIFTYSYVLLIYLAILLCGMLMREIIFFNIFNWTFSWNLQNLEFYFLFIQKKN